MSSNKLPFGSQVLRTKKRSCNAVIIRVSSLLLVENVGISTRQRPVQSYRSSSRQSHKECTRARLREVIALSSAMRDGVSLIRVKVCCSIISDHSRDTVAKGAKLQPSSTKAWIIICLISAGKKSDGMLSINEVAVLISLMTVRIGLWQSVRILAFIGGECLLSCGLYIEAGNDKLFLLMTRVMTHILT